MGPWFPPATRATAQQYLTGKVSATPQRIHKDALAAGAGRAATTTAPVPGAALFVRVGLVKDIGRHGGGGHLAENGQQEGAAPIARIWRSTIDVVWAQTPSTRRARGLRRRQGRPDQFSAARWGARGARGNKQGGYKASVSLASPVFGYAMGQHAADWLEGKSIPQAMDILPRALTLANIAQYESDLADPAAVYADLARRVSYLRMYGNICYDTRDQYLNFPWSSERR